jgi:DNA-binding beta-propeller fold protein YncE
VRSWPTLFLIDPAGKAIVGLSGEGKYDLLDAYISRTIKVFDETKQIDRDKVVGKPEKLAATTLAFPAKITAQPENKRLFIADTNNHRIVVCGADGAIKNIVGNGKSVLADGDLSNSSFHMPHGIAAVGDVLYVADCENHAIRKIDLAANKVETIAGTGKQGHSNGGPAKLTPLNSPWDVALSADGKVLYIAMAGDHRLWLLDLTKDEVSVLAGNGREDIVDGPFASASFAQPSGLALNGDTLYVADSEASGIRALDLKTKMARTVIGFPNLQQGRLFTFGDVDGAIGTAKLQHALGVVFTDGKLYVADTYNHKIKIVDPEKKTSTTFLGDGKSGATNGKAARFYEPGGLAVMDGKLYIADTNNHLIRVVDLKTRDVGALELKK